MDITEAGSTVRNQESNPLCNSEEHIKIGLGLPCKRPICNSEEYKAIGIPQQCKRPVCNTKVHTAIGLDEPCFKPICNSEDHKEVGLDQECTYYCNSEEYKNSEEFKKFGDRTECIQAADVRGRALNLAWMYDGAFWNDVKAMSIPRDRAACTLVQVKDGVSF